MRRGGHEEPRSEEVLAPVPEHERFRRLEELQEEQEPSQPAPGESVNEAED